MKLKKLIAVLLSAVMLFAFTVPAFAAEETTAPSNVSTEEEPSLLTKILDVLHGIIEKILGVFGVKCPFCKAEYEEGSPEAICAEYNDAINSLKSYNKKVKMTKKSNVQLQAANISASAVAAIVNPVLENLAGETESEYTFDKGICVADETVKLADKIGLAKGHDAEITRAHTVKTLQYNKNGKNEYRITLIPEESAITDSGTTAPEAHEAGAKYIDFNALDLGPINILDGEAQYTKTEIILTTDSKGRVTEIKLSVPFEAMITAKAAVISFTTTVLGSIVEEYTFEYLK